MYKPWLFFIIENKQLSTDICLATTVLVKKIECPPQANKILHKQNYFSVGLFLCKENHKKANLWVDLNEIFHMVPH